MSAYQWICLSQVFQQDAEHINLIILVTYEELAAETVFILDKITDIVSLQGLDHVVVDYGFTDNTFDFAKASAARQLAN